MSVPTPHYDADGVVGDFTVAAQQGPTVESFDPRYRVKLYRQTMMQRAGSYSPLAIGTAGPGSSYLIEETTPRNIGADVIEWDRLYAEVPPNRTEGETFIFNQQITIGSDISEIPVPTSSIITYSYVYTTDPESIETIKAYRIGKVTNGTTTLFYSVGTPAAPGSDYILAEDQSISRWRGNIWEKKSRVIPADSLVHS